MDAQITIRPYRADEDLAALTELFNAIQGTAYTMDQVREMTAWPGGGRTAERFVAASGDRLVGQAWRFPQSENRHFVSVDVAPDMRRQRIGSRLLEQVVGAAKAHNAQQVTGAVAARDKGAQLFAEANGFQRAGEVRFFTAPADLELRSPTLPEGFTLKRAPEIGDLQVFADAANRCYHDMWGHYENLQPVTVEKLQGWRTGPDGSIKWDGDFVLFAPDGSPIGVTRAMLEGEGEAAKRVIDAPGVAPEYRALGLQRVLIQAAVGWLKEHGSGPYEIQTWGDFDEAVRIYEGLGFKLAEEKHEVEFVKFL